MSTSKNSSDLERGAAPRSIGDEFFEVLALVHELQGCERFGPFHSHPLLLGASPHTKVQRVGGAVSACRCVARSSRCDKNIWKSDQVGDPAKDSVCRLREHKGRRPTNGGTRLRVRVAQLAVRTDELHVGPPGHDRHHRDAHHQPSRRRASGRAWT